MAELRPAPQAGGADDPPAGSVGEAARPSMTKASRTSSRGRRQVTARPAGCSVGMSFIECTAMSMRAGEQRLLDLAGEEALAAEIGERAVLHPVAAGADRHDREGGLRQAVRGHQPVAGLVRLGERQRAAAGADAERAVGRGRVGGIAGDLLSGALSVRSRRGRNRNAGGMASESKKMLRALTARRCRCRRSG